MTTKDALPDVRVWILYDVGGWDSPVCDIAFATEADAKAMAKPHNRIVPFVPASRIAELKAALRRLLTEAGEGTAKGRALDLLSKRAVAQAEAALKG